MVVVQQPWQSISIYAIQSCGARATGAGRYPRCCSPQWIYSKSLQHSNGPAFHHYCHCGRVAWQRKMLWLPSIVHKFIGLSKVDRYSAAFIDVKLGKCFTWSIFHPFQGREVWRKSAAEEPSHGHVLIPARVKHLVRNVWVNLVFRSLMLVSIFGTIALTCVFACCVETQLKGWDKDGGNLHNFSTSA